MNSLTSIQELQARLTYQEPQVIKAPEAVKEQDPTVFQKFSKELFMERAKKREQKASKQ